MSAILGISAFYHDSAAALVVDGNIVAAAQEERFTRKKHDQRFPANSIKYVLDYAGVAPQNLLAVVFYEKPFLKFERLLETFHATAPFGFSGFVKAMPIWIKEKLSARKHIRECLKNSLELACWPNVPILFSDHHLSHAASAFFPSPFEKAAILTVDGVGEWATTTIYLGQGSKITPLKRMDFPHSLGLFYSAITYYCGFRVNSGEYKLMGLAPYAEPKSFRVISFVEKMYSQLVDLRDDGSFVLNLSNFSFVTSDRMCSDKRWFEIFGVERRMPDDPLLQVHADMAMAAQVVVEEVMFRLANTACRLCGTDNLVMAGGVALNCVANGKILREKKVKNLWVQPASGDAGGALGAALAIWYIHHGATRDCSQNDKMAGTYLGPEFSDLDIARVIRKYSAVAKCYAFDELFACVAAKIATGAIVGWFQGRMEWGPRALGNRSILGDPRDSRLQRRLNLKIKYREGFRPFAPAVLKDYAGEYFDVVGDSPYMQQVAPVRDKHRFPLPNGYQNMDMRDRIAFERSSVPAVTHVDYSARVQTLSRETNPKFYALIDAFRKETGCPVMVNTSFNVRGEPIVCTPEDAYRCFMRTDMDYLVMGGYVFKKNAQPVWQERKKDWCAGLELD